MLRRSPDDQEEITEALGVQVRRAVELLVAAFGRGLPEVDAHDVYRGAVTVMMRIVFLLFAEERRLLPAGIDRAAGRLCAELEERVAAGSEEDLEHSIIGWQRLLALFEAVHAGHDGSLFDPEGLAWLPLTVDDRTVLHMLRAVQFVQIGRGVKTSERRTVSLRTLDVEQIGYVYEGLLSFEGFRAGDVTVGLVGLVGKEDAARLTDLEAMAAHHVDVAGAIAVKFKDSKIGSVARRLVPLDGAAKEEARRRILAVTGGDFALSERLLPFYGLIRTDLRGLPVVVLPGALFVTESALRGNTGTHYTPRELAEEIVEGALEPLVYEPGPLQTADSTQWRPRSVDEILALKVADIAMGSAAFLVAAARYLGRHLLDAALREQLPWALDQDEDAVVVEARRQIIERCLYGVDINPMAVEMAKLSLWLVSMDPKRPFTFLDDRLVAGDSLLGIVSLDQLEVLYLDARRGRDLHHGTLFSWTDGMRSLVADLATGAALAHARKGTGGLDAGSMAAARVIGELADGWDEESAADSGAEWLATDRVEGGFDRRPLHWPLVFPEVFDRAPGLAGFDAVIGNPPFLGGQKLTGVLGPAYREYLVHALGNGTRGSADIVAYFVLRVHQLLNSGGQSGLIATNTLAQGDTREVGLDQLQGGDVTIRRAVKSRRWPSRAAALEFCAIWTTRRTPGDASVRILDGVPVAGITTSLDRVSRVDGPPRSLSSNAGSCFVGSYVLGMGFTMAPEAARSLIDEEPRNQDVLFPYLSGQDLNGRPDSTASRWIINFHDWDKDRAATYPACFDQVVTRVKPERDGNKITHRRERWWQYAARAPHLINATEKLDRVIALTIHTKTVMPELVPARQVFSHGLVVFATADTAMLALLSASPHYWWAAARASSMKADLRYTASDVFETFALPEPTPRMRELGRRLHDERRQLMLGRNAGLTALYNLVFDAACADADIAGLRELHQEIDEAVCAAYGWDDLVADGLDHGFHPAGAYVRFTVGPAVQREILERLLELNHARHAEEVSGVLARMETR